MTMLKLILLAVAFVLAQGRLSDVIDFADVLDDYAAVDSALALAPDGARAAWAAPDGLCIYTFANESADCFPWPEMFRPGFDRYHRLNWSPDGSRLAFTENLFVRLNDSDIWVYDLAAGTFTNRTDDGETRVIFDGPQKRQLDYAPLWADDGSLYFFRSAGFQEGDAMALYRLPAESDTPKLVLDAARTLPPGSIYIPPALSPDGTQMAVVSLAPSRDEPRNGVWIIDLEDGSIVRAAALPALRGGQPEWQPVDTLMPMAVGWVDDSALVVTMFDGAYAASVSQNYQYIDVTTGKVTPLIDLTGIASAPDAFSIGEDGHSGIFQMPRVGIIGAGVFYYAHYEVRGGEESTTISAVPLPPDGSAPQPVGAVEGCAVGRLRGDPRFLSTLTATNQALLYNCLLTFE